MDAALAPTASPLANSPVRTMLWTRPAGHDRHPFIIEKINSMLAHAQETGRGPVWDALSDATRLFDPPSVLKKKKAAAATPAGVDAGGSGVPDDEEEIVWVATTPAERPVPATPAIETPPPKAKGTPRTRTRRWRSEGGRNFITFLMALVWNADLTGEKSRGYIATLRAGAWIKLKVCDSEKANAGARGKSHSLDAFAFGRTIAGERSTRRTERHMRMAVDAGFVQVTQLRTRKPDGSIRSETAIKVLTPKLLKLLGVWALHEKIRKEKFRVAGEEAAKELAERLGGEDPRREQLAKGRRRRQGTSRSAGTQGTKTTGPPAPPGKVVPGEFDKPAGAAGLTPDAIIAALKAKLR